MEEDLKILNVEYLSNHWSDFTQILNLSLVDQTKIERHKPLNNFFSNYKLNLRESDQNQKSLNGRQHPNYNDIEFNNDL